MMAFLVSFKDLPKDKNPLFSRGKPQKIVCVGLFEKHPLPPTLALLDLKTNHAITSVMTSARLGKKGAPVVMGPWKECSLRHVVLFGLGKLQHGQKSQEQWLDFGGQVIKWMEQHQETHVDIWLPDSPSSSDKIAHIDHIAHNVALATSLRAYAFRKHLTLPRKEDKEKEHNRPSNVVLCTKGHQALAQQWKKQGYPLAEGTCLARDLANEPPNILTPKVYAQRIQEQLEPLGVKVHVLGEKKLESLGMGSLLAVGQGSAQESHVVVMEWNGNTSNRKKKPIALVGKGVCFDSGGISLKPPRAMDEMRGDMAGSAAVVGAMASLAGQKVSQSVVGIVGLVENMPGSMAFRPGDIITSLSGQTIEVLNTDAEGRLVLADLLTYIQEQYTPSCIIDLATLTGAIVVSLGNDYAGLFSNNTPLSKHLEKCGEHVGERMWRFPMGACYDKQIDSPVADMKNISSGMGAGSITAAQFLGRFVQKNTPWAHIDIAGVGIKSQQTALNASWASGFGVRLLDHFVKTYE